MRPPGLIPAGFSGPPGLRLTGAAGSPAGVNLCFAARSYVRRDNDRGVSAALRRPAFQREGDEAFAAPGADVGVHAAHRHPQDLLDNRLQVRAPAVEQFLADLLDEVAGAFAVAGLGEL